MIDEVRDVAGVDEDEFDQQFEKELEIEDPDNEKFYKVEALKFYFDECVNTLPNMQSESRIMSYINGQKLGVDINKIFPVLEKVCEQGIASVLHADNTDAIQDNAIVRSFYEIIPAYIDKNQVSDCCIYYENRERNICLAFGEDELTIIRSRYSIELDDTILYIDEHYEEDKGVLDTDWDFEYGIVISSIGIHCRYYKSTSPSTFFHFVKEPNYDLPFLLSWSDFDKVIYKELVFYFYYGGKLVAQIEKNMLCDGLSTEKCKRLANDLTNMSQLVDPNYSIDDLIDQRLFDEALQKADNMICSGEDVPYGYWAKSLVMKIVELEKTQNDSSYQGNDEFNKNMNTIIKGFWSAIKAKETTNDDDKKDFIDFVLLSIARTENLIGKFMDSRNHYIEGLNAYDNAYKDECMEELIVVEESLRKTWDNYTTQYAYKDRKFIMPIRDNEIGGCIVNGITTFRMSNIPSCIRFPMGHPAANQLYIGHPYNPSLYVPYEDSEDMFFMDKVHELRYLLECLGAEMISITSIKGKEVSELRDENNRYAVDGEIKRFSAGVEVNTQNKNQNDSSSHSHRSMTVKLDPMQKPFLPEGLIWYNEMPQWQRLVQSRLHGNLLEYSEFVSTAETKFTSSSEMTDIKASAKFLWAKAHAEVNKCFEKQFKESTETQWKVNVKFRSVKDFEDEVIETIEVEETAPANQIGLSEKELEYAEEVKFCLEDGNVIDDSERRLLERKRIKLGISQERAIEIENGLVQPQLTEDEKDYLEAVKDELVDCQIPESSKRLLDRLRNRMGIAEERAKEIELMAINMN